MSTQKDILEEISNSSPQTEDRINERYSALGLKFNPFPKSGTADCNSSDIVNKFLKPVDPDVKEKLNNYIRDALLINKRRPEDKFICATITGDYGSGKTQLLLYTKYLLSEIASLRWKQKNPYVVYINNPGVKLSELIGSIIDRIGEDMFKKLLWAKIILAIRHNKRYKEDLSEFENYGISFPGFNPDPYAPENTISYKCFLDSFVKVLSPTKRKRFDEVFKNIIIEVINTQVHNNTLSQYFFEVLSEDYGVNRTWDALSNGTIRNLEKKEAKIIRFIVDLIKEQGYTDFFILVDEFEDITEGRLSKSQADNYIHNLRTLLDQEREWCLMFAMTGGALAKLKSVSPPLADRITSRLISLQNLNENQAVELVTSYLQLAKIDATDKFVPFDISGIQHLIELDDGNARQFLKHCFVLVEKAVDGNTSRIDKNFVAKYHTREV